MVQSMTGGRKSISPLVDGLWFGTVDRARVDDVVLPALDLCRLVSRLRSVERTVRARLSKEEEPKRISLASVVVNFYPRRQNDLIHPSCGRRTGRCTKAELHERGEEIDAARGNGDRTRLGSGDGRRDTRACDTPMYTCRAKQYVSRLVHRRADRSTYGRRSSHTTRASLSR
jgi:hypothetical protein